MHTMLRSASAVFVLALAASASAVEVIDGGVVQIEMPGEEITLLYLESKGGMTLKLDGLTASVAARKLYIGDGEIAAELRADSQRGILLQGRTLLLQGFRFKPDSTIQLLPGYKKLSELVPGDIYVNLRGVNFALPKEGR